MCEYLFFSSPYKHLREGNYGKLPHDRIKQSKAFKSNGFINIVLFFYYNTNSYEIVEMSNNLLNDFLGNSILPAYYRMRILDLFYIVTNFTMLMRGKYGDFVRNIYSFLSSFYFDYYDCI